MCTPFLMQSDGKKGMSYFLDGKSPSIKTFHNFSLFSVSMVQVDLSLELFKKFCSRTEWFSSRIFHSKTEIYLERSENTEFFPFFETAKIVY